LQKTRIFKKKNLFKNANFQFFCKNVKKPTVFTIFRILPFKKLLKNATVELQLSSENLKLAHIINAPEIKPLTSSNIFVGLAKNPEMKLISSTVTTMMKFEANEINLSTNTLISEYDDEFFFEEFEISLGDYFTSYALTESSFMKLWNSFEESQETASTYQLNYKTVEAAIKGLIKHFGN